MSRFTLNCLPVLGLLLMVMSLVGVGLHMFKYQEVPEGETHRMKIKVKGVEFTKETNHGYYGVFVGLIKT